MSDATCADLLAWLDGLRRPASALTPLAGDVSRRAYHRARHADGTTSVVATYPDEMADVCRRFQRTTELLAGAGVRVPRIRAADCDRGRMLLEDAGDRTLYDLRGESWQVLSTWLDRAAGLAAAIQRLPAAAAAKLNPPLDGDLMRRELDQTWRLLLEPRGLAGDGAERPRLRAALDEVCSRLDAERRVVCHRDFMARNLVPVEGGELVVLDHQDLRLGPAAYDLASLLNDSLFPPSDLERRLVADHLTEHLAEHLDGGGDSARPDAAALESYRRCVVQRALKACGTFAAFARRGSRRHLRLVPPTLRRAAENLRRLPEGRDLGPVVDRWRAESAADG